ncbi:hypothetical protein [Devosia sp. Root105]|uniref:hypothetical protein n=1 Tax=Devosia sp. Root105 TaxID=1736423 RepID=UPI0006F97C47|nr:hypothetical protein [Devosia sp. Root105]KQU96481.1 hypothetical protein ASC68_13970 [Devosia sp. Root105]
MPISPSKLTLYPGGSIQSPEWLALRRQVEARAGGCCENCGVKNHALGGRTAAGEFVQALPLGDNGLRILWPRQGDEAWCRNGTEEPVVLKIIMIVCTTAHLDGKLVDHSLNNLRFWCQQCHLRHDAHLRKLEELERAGQLPLFAEAR